LLEKLKKVLNRELSAKIGKDILQQYCFIPVNIQNGILFVVEKDENLILYRINYEKEQLSVVEMDMISKRTDDSDQNIRIDASAPEKPLIQYDEVE